METKEARTDDEIAKSATAAPKTRRMWFPFAWVGTLATVCVVLWNTAEDRGVANSAIHAAILLSVFGLAFWTIRCSGLSRGWRWSLALVPTLLVVCQYLQLSPIEAITNGDVGVVSWRWRWAEPDRTLEVPQAGRAGTIPWESTPRDYPRFLGNGYWAEVSEVQLETDWNDHPPRELWRKKIGAGWSAFAIVGNYAVTQEQRDENELVTCYDIRTGDIVWTHADAVRWDPSGGGALGYAGPRATPTLHDGKVFTQGATGILNCLDASTGEILWSHDTFEKHNAENITWGKASSPLIVDDMVVLSVGGTENQSIVAYKIDSGGVAWASGSYHSSYASPVLAEFAGVQQVVSVDEGFVTSRRADTGEFLWEIDWPSDSGANAAASQPVPLSGDRLFLSKGYGLGSVLLQVQNDDETSWQIKSLWSGGLKPVMKTKMGNVVIRDGYVYGLDEVNLQCIELESGKKMWKKRRRPGFGHGQIMLLGDTILVLTEFGELVLVEASPAKYQELSSLRAFSESQITWNNPAFSAPYLLVRNAQEAVCYELPLVGIRTAYAQ